MLIELVRSAEEAQAMLCEGYTDVAILQVPKGGVRALDSQEYTPEQLAFLLMVIDDDLCDLLCRSLKPKRRPKPNPYTFAIPAPFTIPTLLNCVRKDAPDAETRHAWIDGVVPDLCYKLARKFRGLGDQFTFFADKNPNDTSGLLLVYHWDPLVQKLERSRVLAHIFTATMQYKLTCPHRSQLTGRREFERWLRVRKYLEFYLNSHGLRPLRPSLF